MMGTHRSKILLLLALLAAWGAILGVRHLTTTPPPPAPRSAGTDGPRKPVGQGGGLPRLKADLLNAPRPPVPSQVQNIFGSAAPPPPPPKAVAHAAPPPPPPPPPDPFLEEAKQLRYLGYVDHQARRKALILHGQEIHILGAGEAFGGRFRVKEFTDDSLLLASPDGAKEARLDLRQEGAKEAARPAPRPAPAPGLPRPGVPFPRM